MDMNIAQTSPLVKHPNYILSIHMATQMVVRKDQEVKLTINEWAILQCLVENRNCVLSPYQIIQHAGIDLCDETVRLYIMRLRQKLEPNPKKPQLISTLHGRGYRFTMIKSVVRIIA